MPEFTGERLVPELVEADLLNEHMARYVLARSLAQGADVLDAGCGVGYGTAELAKTAASAMGLDCAPEAVAEARRRYSGLGFLEGSCEQMPLEAARFDLVVAFEVIEHLDDWRAFLRECVRVLKPHGRLLVSTPNKTYYAESRRQAGPNPFHRHEFDYAEFQAELRACFAHVALLLQNHAEGVLIAAPGPLESGALAGGVAGADPENAHFFIALCSQAQVVPPEPLFYLPASANVLRERERHIDLLAGELALKDQALSQSRAEHRGLVDRFRALQSELEERNQWAADRQRESDQRGERILALQQEIEERNRWAADRHRESVARGERVVELQNELSAQQHRAQQAIDQLHLAVHTLREQLEAAVADLSRSVGLLDRAEATVVERTAWAEREQQKAEALERTVALVSQSRWLRLGRRLGLGPEL